MFRLAGVTACLIHILVALTFIVAERSALFPGTFPEAEKPVLIGDPHGGDPYGSGDAADDSAESDGGDASPTIADSGENFAESSPAFEQPPLEQESAPVVEESIPSESVPSDSPRPRAPRSPLPSRETRQARWRRPAEARDQSRQNAYQSGQSNGRALQEAFSAYTQATQRNNPRGSGTGVPGTTGSRSGTKSGGSVPWGQRAQKNAENLELDMYVRRIMRALKERAQFFEETITVAQSIHTRVSVILVIERSGTLRHVEVRPSTGIVPIDHAIEQFCRYATIPPLPRTYPNEELVLPIDVRIEQAAGVHRMRFIVDAA